MEGDLDSEFSEKKKKVVTFILNMSVNRTQFVGLYGSLRGVSEFAELIPNTKNMGF